MLKFVVICLTDSFPPSIMTSLVKVSMTQVYTATVRPHIVYDSNARSSAARTNLDQLTKAKSAGLRIITGGMKTTPISEMERTAGLLSLEERREEKTLAPKRKDEQASFTPVTFQV